ncbi:MAG TPA: winged helix-turn-helix domain-containing protein [Steroidobacteraceae bacterium]|jgi:TolB-like protein/DNA-binding winged helix-turn-helix (wHTH) protein|nr:winged helix-turn-helix domain-containing protein [Steroidobacteraceae bacterium]
MNEPQTRESQALREPALHYRVGDLLIDVGRQRVMRDTQMIALPKLSFDLLVVLARAAPNLVSGEALLRQVWPKVIVGPETLNQRVKLVRDALGDDCRHPRYVEGLRGRGYRLIPAVEVHFIAPPAAPESADAATPDAAPPALAVSVDASIGGSRRGRQVQGLWIASLLFALLGGTLVPSPWRHAIPTVTPGPTRSFAASPQTIAVLPFDDLGPTVHDAYLAVGIAGAVLHELASDPQLTVVARSSSFSLGEPPPDAREAGRRLGVRYIIEGSVQHSGHLLRVTAQLIDTRTNRELWSTKLDRDFGAIFALQDQISDQVAREVEATLRAGPAAHRSRPRSSDVNLCVGDSAAMARIGWRHPSPGRCGADRRGFRYRFASSALRSMSRPVFFV